MYIQVDTETGVIVGVGHLKSPDSFNSDTTTGIEVDTVPDLFDDDRNPLCKYVDGEIVQLTNTEQLPNARKALLAKYASVVRNALIEKQVRAEVQAAKDSIANVSTKAEAKQILAARIEAYKNS